jgi:hypothetical protein
LPTLGGVLGPTQLRCRRVLSIAAAVELRSPRSREGANARHCVASSYEGLLANRKLKTAPVVLRESRQAALTRCARS